MRGKIWRIGDERERRKFGTSGSNDFDGYLTGVMVREHLARGPTHTH